MEIRCEKCDQFTRHDAIEALLDQRKALTAETDALRAQLAAANERAEKAEVERADALRCSGENAKAWQEAVCDEAVKRTHLLKEIGLTEQQRDALAALVAELEGAQSLDAIKKQVLAEYIDNHGTTCDCCQHVLIDVTASEKGIEGHCVAGDPEGEGSGCAWGWHYDADRREKRVQAAALREVAKDLESTEINATRITASGVRDLFVYRLLEMAERLEAEAANG